MGLRFVLVEGDCSSVSLNMMKAAPGIQYSGWGSRPLVSWTESIWTMGKITYWEWLGMPVPTGPGTNCYYQTVISLTGSREPLTHWKRVSCVVKRQPSIVWLLLGRKGGVWYFSVSDNNEVILSQERAAAALKDGFRLLFWIHGANNITH